MRVQLLEHTPNADHLVAKAAKQCYSEEAVGASYPIIDLKSDAALIAKVVSMGHLSVLEHASFTFAISGISRACSHQLVRFRVASFSQQSQRYVASRGFKRITPPSISKIPRALAAFEKSMIIAEEAYEELLSFGVTAEDARFVLPNAAETKLVMTMNARELHHAFGLRCCTHAQWEIRDLFNAIREIVRNYAPAIFAKCGPSCEVLGVCSEGPRSCGKHLVINTK